MKTLASPQVMQRQSRRWLREGRRVVLVPTMGALHEGHLSLIRRARKRAGEAGLVVVSIYVNPTQFNDPKDLKAYPRTLKADQQLCRAEGVDAVFAPETLYPEGASVEISENELALSLEGEHRPGHFAGVMTVVAKLFHLVQPTEAVFGEKDFQQAAVIRRMIRDLDFPVRLILGPTVRESDGLAMSSRNVRLKGRLREQAAVLPAALRLVKEFGDGPVANLKRRLKRLMEAQPDVSVDYIEVVDAESFRPVRKAMRGTRLLLAAQVGPVRLIDNTGL